MLRAPSGIAHVHVGAGEIELGADLAHGHGLEVRQRQILRGRAAAWPRRRRPAPSRCRRRDPGLPCRCAGCVPVRERRRPGRHLVAVRGACRWHRRRRGRAVPAQGAQARGRRAVRYGEARLRQRRLELVLVELPGAGGRGLPCAVAAAARVLHDAARLLVETGHQSGRIRGRRRGRASRLVDRVDRADIETEVIDRRARRSARRAPWRSAVVELLAHGGIVRRVELPAARPSDLPSRRWPP